MNINIYLYNKTLKKNKSFFFIDFKDYGAKKNNTINFILMCIYF